MGLGDLGNSILIITCYIFLTMLIFIAISIEYIKKHWQQYKCNPLVMPFAGIFGRDPVDNLTQCIMEAQSKFMQTFLKPIYDALAGFTDIGVILSQFMDFLKSGIDIQQFGLIQLLEELQTRLTMLVIGINKLLINIVAVFSKLSAMIGLVFRVLESTVKTSEALWQELPGTIIRIFMPDLNFDTTDADNMGNGNLGGG